MVVVVVVMVMVEVVAAQISWGGGGGCDSRACFSNTIGEIVLRDLGGCRENGFLPTDYVDQIRRRRIHLFLFFITRVKHNL